MADKLPAIQFYPADWRKDPGIQMLSYHDRGVWFELLCLMHESPKRGILLAPNGNVIPDEALARLLGLDRQVLNKTRLALTSLGVASVDEVTGALMSRRMVRDEEIRSIRRVVGKKGGNPGLLNQKATNGANQNAPPSTSPSSSASTLRERGRPRDLEEVKEQARRMKLDEKDAESFWRNYNTQGWLKANGLMVTDWESLLVTWCESQVRQRIAQSKFQPETQAKPPNGAPPTAYTLKTQLEAVQAQIKDVRSRGVEDAVGWRPKTQEDGLKLKELKAKEREINGKLANLT